MAAPGEADWKTKLIRSKAGPKPLLANAITALRLHPALTRGRHLFCLPGTHAKWVAVEDGAVKLPRGVRLVGAVPSQVRLVFERRTDASVPVTVPVTGEGHDGYYVASQNVQPGRLEIVGPASHVARVTQAVTDAVDVSQVVGTSQFRVNAFLNDPYVRFQSSPQVEVTITMKKK